jgi:hypothetical protein
MTHHGPVRRPADHGWVLAAWVLPLAVAIGFTVMTAGIGVVVIPIAIAIGLLATVVHHWGRSE